MTFPAPIAIAAAADLLALYGIIEVPSQPAVSASALAAAGATVFFLVLGLSTGWQAPPFAMPADAILF